MEHKELLKVPWDWQIGEDVFSCFVIINTFFQHSVDAVKNHLLTLFDCRSSLRWFQCLHVRAVQLHAGGDKEDECRFSQSLSAHS